MSFKYLYPTKDNILLNNLYIFVLMNINNLNKSKEGLYLPLMEAFHTIQGEGFFSGKPAFFKNRRL